MTIATDLFLAGGVLLVWIGTAAFLRLRSPFQKIHAVTLVNLAAGAPMIVAAFLADGVTSRSLKCAVLWLCTLAIGALVSHATGRALHLREGERL